MFSYYRFIGCKYSEVQERIESQAKHDNLKLRVIESFDDSDENKNRISIVVAAGVIKDIFRG